MGDAEEFAGLDIEAYSPYAIRNNLALVEYCRAFLALMSGSAAGILGLTGLYGFAFYGIVSLAMSILLALKTQSKYDRYFLTKMHVWTNGVFGELFTYLLVWTFMYGMIHVF
ncbi:ER membrane protein complex subunit 6-like [Hydractinia symbiolongicarpus]|uniref:ER membrane protein complex subunit 6-like n=1 Tax=Hydractinia symbiolongicarpus TaxID=13093 RepID=UPI00254D1048|nr:ER membrane protein complex subunit 6-like [Hydractinia symbiolongicarpus]XP_057302621.1 ER membrane protein complex subunit 6-like [Hydractinia symbiolongicarpus]